MSAKKTTNKKESKKPKENDSKEDIKKLRKEVKQLKLGLKGKNDKLLRSYADLQNIQKRVNKDLTSSEIKLKERFVSELIDLRELLQKAYEDDNPKNGLKIILNDINQFLEKENIEFIDCVGKKFDHALHHAVTTVEKKDRPDGEIIDEIKKGFRIDDVVLRPSHVVVVKNNKEKK